MSRIPCVGKVLAALLSVYEGKGLYNLYSIGNTVLLLSALLSLSSSNWKLKANFTVQKLCILRYTQNQ